MRSLLLKLGVTLAICYGLIIMLAAGGHDSRPTTSKDAQVVEREDAGTGSSATVRP